MHPLTLGCRRRRNREQLLQPPKPTTAGSQRKLFKVLYREFIKYCVFSWKCCDFSELCKFWCSAGVWPASVCTQWQVKHQCWERGRKKGRERVCVCESLWKPPTSVQLDLEPVGHGLGVEDAEGHQQHQHCVGLEYAAVYLYMYMYICKCMYIFPCCSCLSIYLPSIYLPI